MSVAPPTPAQLQSANLVALPSNAVAAVKNGWALRAWNGSAFVPVGMNAPIGEQLYAVPNWQSPRPAKGSYPSQITPPADTLYPSHTVGFFDDFVDGLTGVLAKWFLYDGVPGGTNGRWLTSHVVVENSIASLLAYQDSAGADPGALNWVGGGMQTQTRFPVGSIFHVACRADTLAGFTSILLLMGNNWPPEIDFDEGGNVWIHWGQGNANRSGFTIPASLLTEGWHEYVCNYGATTISVTIDGVAIGSIPNPSPASDPYGLQQNQFLSAQYQSGDGGGTLVARPDITAANAPRQQLDWVKVFVPVVNPVAPVANVEVGALLLNEDFSTMASLDSSVFAHDWWSATGQMNGVTTDPANVSIENGQLALTLSSATDGATVSTNPAAGASPGFMFAEGYVEAVVTFPSDGTALANWPAFWTCCQNWQNGEEFDIAEVLGGAMTTTYHLRTNDVDAGQNSGPIAGDWQGEHAYGMLIRGGVQTVYFDGVAVYSRKISATPQPQFLIFTHGVDASRPPVIGAKILVKNVRAWA